jgi:hypothetical protein
MGGAVQNHSEEISFHLLLAHAHLRREVGKQRNPILLPSTLPINIGPTKLIAGSVARQTACFDRPTKGSQ